MEVVDEIGRDVSSASVWIETLQGKRVTIREALDGYAEVEGLQPGSYAVWARRGEGVASERVIVSTPREEPVRVVIPSTGRIEGTVVGPRGSPVKNALVTCSGNVPCASIPGTSRFRSGEAGQFVLEVPTGRVLETGRRRPVPGVGVVMTSELVPQLMPLRATSAGNGEFTFSLVDPGQYTLGVSPRGGDTVSKTRHVTVGSDPIDLGDVVIEAE